MKLIWALVGFGGSAAWIWLLAERWEIADPAIALAFIFCALSSCASGMKALMEWST